MLDPASSRLLLFTEKHGECPISKTECPSIDSATFVVGSVSGGDTVLDKFIFPASPDATDAHGATEAASSPCGEDQQGCRRGVRVLRGAQRLSRRGRRPHGARAAQCDWGEKSSEPAWKREPRKAAREAGSVGGLKRPGDETATRLGGEKSSPFAEDDAAALPGVSSHYCQRVSLKEPSKERPRKRQWRITAGAEQ